MDSDFASQNKEDYIMSLEAKIIGVHAREILDSRGNPTIEVAVTAETETTGKKNNGS